jgi:hypothetical protein
MRSFSFWQAFYLAFGSADFYREVARAWTGALTLLYLVVLTVLWWLPFGVTLYAESARFVENDAPHLIANFPTVTVTRGKAATNVPQPYAIENSQSHERLLVIDTTGQIQTLEQASATALLTADRILIRDGMGGAHVFDFASLDSLTVDRERLSSWADFLRTGFAWAMSAIAIPALWLYRVFQTLAYAGLGFFFARVTGVSLTYPQLWRLAAVALTPAVWLDAAVASLGYLLPGPVSLLVSLSFLYFAVRANKSQDAVVAA